MCTNEINEILELSGCNKIITEMADIMSANQQYGFLITVFSDDHEPPHAHIRNLSGKTIGMFLITDNPPMKPEDIQLYRTEAISRKIKKSIVEWANKIDSDFECIYWITLKNFWKRFQSSNYNKR